MDHKMPRIKRTTGFGGRVFLDHDEWLTYCKPKPLRDIRTPKAPDAEIKAGAGEGQAQATPEERAEYEETEETLKAVFKRIVYDPASGPFAPRDRQIEIDIASDRQ